MTTKIGINSPVAADEGTSPDERRMQTPDVAPEEVFPQSVASGDPSTKGAILWTRLHPDWYGSGEPLLVEVSDDGFEDTCWTRGVAADRLSRKHDYTTKVNVDDSGFDLEAGRWYQYRFEYKGVRSHTGRFKTLPTGEPDHVTFAVTTCQNYVNGYFRAYNDLLERDKDQNCGVDIDYLLDLGDFTYENVTQPPGSETYTDHQIEELPSGATVALDLADYRCLYRKYRSCPHLRRTLEQYTRIHVLDDHEIANEIYWDYDESCPRAPGHPFHDYPERMRRLLRDALKAWAEYTPTRVTENDDPDGLHEALDLYQAFQFGDLATLFRTDERLRKNKPPSTSWRHRIRKRVKRGGRWVQSELPTLDRYLHEELDHRRGRANECLPEWAQKRFQYWLPRGYFDEYPGSTMLGTKQRDCFKQGLGDASTPWTVWLNEVLTLHLWLYVTIFDLHNHDAWDGYYGERQEIMEVVDEAGVENFITLTGDMHSYLTGYQRVDPKWYKDLLAIPFPNSAFADCQLQRSAVGIELMTPGVTSVNIAEKITESLARSVGLGGTGETATSLRGLLKGVLTPHLGRLLSWIVPRTRPHIMDFNGHEWGYSIVTFTPEECHHRTYTVDKTGDEADGRMLNHVRIPAREKGDSRPPQIERIDDPDECP